MEMETLKRCMGLTVTARQRRGDECIETWESWNGAQERKWIEAKCKNEMEKKGQSYWKTVETERNEERMGLGENNKNDEEEGARQQKTPEKEW